MKKTKRLTKPNKAKKGPLLLADHEAMESETDQAGSGKLVAELFKPHTGVPVSVVRSALFGVGEKGEFLHDRMIDVDKRLGVATIKYTGPYLNQDHFKVWQATLYLAKAGGGSIGEDFLVSNFADLVRLCGSDPGDSQRNKRTWELLKDLIKANVEIQTTRVEYSGNLLREAVRHEESGLLLLNLNARLVNLLSNETLSNDILRLAGLGKDRLAAWLHNYYASQKEPPLLTVSEIQKLCGTKLDLPRLRQRLKRAFKKLEGGDRPLVDKWRIDKATDVVYVEKNPTTVDMRTPEAIAQGSNARRQATEKSMNKSKRFGPQNGPNAPTGFWM